MDINILLIILIACLIYLKMNQGKNNYLCYLVIALVLVCLLMRRKNVEGFDVTTDPPWNNAPSGIKIRWDEAHLRARGVMTQIRYATITPVGTEVSVADLDSLKAAGAAGLEISDEISLTATQRQVISYKYVEDDAFQHYGIATRMSSLDNGLQEETTIPAPSVDDNYLIIKVAEGEFSMDYYIYKVAFVDPGPVVAGSAGSGQTVTGMCSGNTNTVAEPDVNCSSFTDGSPKARSAEIASREPTACCEGRCTVPDTTPPGYTLTPAGTGAAEALRSNTVSPVTDPAVVFCTDGFGPGPAQVRA